MASSGLLISSYSKNLKEKTKGFVDIPMYHSPAEARALCKYALENPNYVKDLSLASNAFVEKNCRWKYNFKKLEEFTHLKLMNGMKNQNSNYEIISTIGYQIKRKQNLRNKKSHIGWAIKFLISELPLINFLYPESKRNKLYCRIGRLNNND